jgi:hypothetical protein
MNTLLLRPDRQVVVVTSTISWLYSRNAADHLRDLKLVLDRLQAGNWYLKRKVPLQRAVMKVGAHRVCSECRLIP